MNAEQIALLGAWQEAQRNAEAAKVIVAKELELRKLVAQSLFTAPKEGTNNMELQGGWKLKYVHKLDYKLDETALPSISERLFRAGVSPDTLITYSPKLSVKEYRALDDNIRLIVDEALTIKPSSPTLELIAPK